ncbi:unnamed protein product [Aureobasidium uvarum]|uniref:Uncharacterized protein n=1 Tax=Aureobasidium uvarum TaxID=2773716 RepID=A0A9N8PRK7_9PEZI|nr:unnamed protein product [Aureobasidium uvarum]
MAPAHRSTSSGQPPDMPPKERLKKRNNIQSGVLRTDEEEREYKRSRLSSHISGYSKYVRAPQDYYERGTTTSNNGTSGGDPYTIYGSMDESSQRNTPVEPPRHNPQPTSHYRQKVPENIVAGLGNSILTRRPFQEESDSSDNSGPDEAAVQEEDKYDTPPLFVYSSESTGASNIPQQHNYREASNIHSDSTSQIYQRDQQSLQPPYSIHSGPGHLYDNLPRQQPALASLRQPNTGQHQSQSVLGRQPRFIVPEQHEQNASHHEQARFTYTTFEDNEKHSQRRKHHRQSQPGAEDTREAIPVHHRDETTRAQHEVNNTHTDALSSPAVASRQKRANKHSQLPGLDRTAVPGTRPKHSSIPDGFKHHKDILSTVKPRKNRIDKPQPRQFQEDIDYPPPEPSLYTQTTNIAQPARPQFVSPLDLIQDSVQHHDSPPAVPSVSTQSSSNQALVSRIPREHLMNFMPDDFDNRVWEYMHRKEQPMDWHGVVEILQLTQTPYELESLKARQRLYAAKLALKLQERATVSAEALRMQGIVSLENENHQRPAAPTAKRPVPPAITAPTSASATPLVLAPVVPAPQIRLPEAKRLAGQLEQERLAWATKEAAWTTREAELQQRIKTFEEDSAARTIERAEHEKQLKLKTEVEEKYQKLKAEAQTHKESLRDEKALRVKAERDLKAAQSDVHRRALAQAASARKTEVTTAGKIGKATGGGFTFSKDGEDEDGGDDDVYDEGVKKTPTKRRKSRKSSDLREDGHPHTGGKSLPPAAIQALYKHLNNCKDEEEAEEPPEAIQEEDLTYFVYTVCRKQWPITGQEPDNDSAVVCGDYTYLNAANVAVTNEILRPHGTSSAIKIDPEGERSLHQGMGEHKMAWAQLDVPQGHVKVWVQRQLHTEFVGELPLFEDKGILSKTVFAVRQQTFVATATATSIAAPPSSTTIQEDDEIYTTFDLANIKANEKVFKLLWPEGTQSSRIDAVKAREEARKQRKQRLEDLEDHGELFTEEINNEDGSCVKVWVIQKTVIGPRN